MFKFIVPQPQHKEHKEAVSRLKYCFQFLLTQEEEAPNEGADWKERYTPCRERDKDNRQTVLMVWENNIIGYLTYKTTPCKEDVVAQVMELYIRPSKRKVGFKACYALLGWLKQEGITLVEAYCLEASYKLIRFITRHKKTALLLMDEDESYDSSYDFLRAIIIALK